MGKLTALLFMIMFFIGTDTFLISPLIPTLQELFDIPTEISGWMVGAYALGYAIFALIAGPLSDGWDRKKVMFYGMLCFSASTVLWRLCHGLLVDARIPLFGRHQRGLYVASSLGFHSGVVPRGQERQSAGIVMAGLASAQAFGIPIGGLLASTHWSYPFYVIGACSMAVSVFIYFALPSMKPSQDQRTRLPIFKRYLPLLTSRIARRAFLGHFLFNCGFMAAFAFIGKSMTDRFALSVDQVGYVMFFLGLGNLIGKLCRRLRDSKAQSFQHVGRRLSSRRRLLYRFAVHALGRGFRWRILLRIHEHGHCLSVDHGASDFAESDDSRHDLKLGQFDHVCRYNARFLARRLDLCQL